MGEVQVLDLWEKSGTISVGEVQTPGTRSVGEVQVIDLWEKSR